MLALIYLTRTSKKNYLNLNLKVLDFSSLDGLTAVVEEMDFREHEDDFRQPGDT